MSIKSICLKIKYLIFRFRLPLAVIAAFTIGVIVPIDVLPPKITTFHEERNSFQYKFINPLLECDSTNFIENPHLSKLKSNVNNYINNQINQKQIDFASVYYRDLNNGPWFGINEKEKFSPSSLIKVPLMITYLKLAEADPSILQKPLLNTATYDPSSQNFPPQITLIPNQKYTVDELIRRMIVYSDNMAYNLLNDNVNGSVVMSVYNDLGVDISSAQANPNGNIISVTGYSSFFRILYNSSYLNRDMSEKALKYLSQSVFTQGLVAGVPNDIVVSHKFGERQYLDTGEKQLHDCGIIYDPDIPYLLCVMTRGNNFSNLISTIKNISNMVYISLPGNN